MKNSIKIIAIGILLSFGMHANTVKDSLGLPGDNLDLRAVLSIFKNSKNVEDFERKLNSADTKVNNLDLNHDGKVDYIRVIDYGKKDFHSLVLQTPISKSESQDIAVIEVEKKKGNEAHIQIVGDETLYGKNYIIEPQDQSKQTKQAADNGNNDDVYASGGASPYYYDYGFVNVWGWPCVSYMYSPGYVFWVSPWYWGYYPWWWNPWAPYGWWYYQQNLVVFNYYGVYYGRTYHNRISPAHRLYYEHRTTSTYVQKTVVNNNVTIGGPRQRNVNNNNIINNNKSIAMPRQKQFNNVGNQQTQPAPRFEKQQPIYKSRPINEGQPAHWGNSWPVGGERMGGRGMGGGGFGGGRRR